MPKFLSYYFNLPVLSVWIALYVGDVFIDVFDGSHGYKVNMLDWDKKCHISFEGNFMMNNEQVFFNKLSVISLTFFFTTVLFHEAGR